MKVLLVCETRSKSVRKRESSFKREKRDRNIKRNKRKKLGQIKYAVKDVKTNNLTPTFLHPVALLFRF